MKCQYCSLSYDDKDFCPGCGAPKGKSAPEPQPEPEVVPSIQFRGASWGAPWVIALVTIGCVILIALLGMGMGEKKPIPAPQTGIYNEATDELVWTGIATEIDWCEYMTGHFDWKSALVIRNATGVAYSRIGYFYIASSFRYAPNQTNYLLRVRSNQYAYWATWDRNITNVTGVPVRSISESEVLALVFPARPSSGAGPAVPAGYWWSPGPWVKDYEGRILEYVGDAIGHVFTLEDGGKLRLAGDLFYNQIPINQTVRIWRCTAVSPNKIFIEEAW